MLLPGGSRVQEELRRTQHGTFNFIWSRAAAKVTISRSLAWEDTLLPSGLCRCRAESRSEESLGRCTAVPGLDVPDPGGGGGNDRF